MENYVIKNHKNVYVRLDDSGKTVPCSESDKQLFDYQKAKNICSCLPKTMQRMHFQIVSFGEKNNIEFENDTGNKREDRSEKKIIQNDNYIPSSNIIRWLEKFGICGDTLDEAKKREEELLKELHTSDNEIIDILHTIEMQPRKDLYNGWKLYTAIKNNRHRRREIKDELLIIQNVLQFVDPKYMYRENIQKAIDGLFTRKYRFRVVEEDEEEVKSNGTM